MTDLQLDNYFDGFADTEFSGWQGWVYEVRETIGGYSVLIAMTPPRALLWTRNVEIRGVPVEVALALEKEQKVAFSGTIHHVERFLSSVCNPLVVTNVTFDGLAVAHLPVSAAREIADPAKDTVNKGVSFSGICKTDPGWTEIQTEQYLAGFTGRDVIGWDGWVYEVSEFGGQYKLLVAMEPPGGLLWTRDVEIGGIPGNLAVALKKGQPVRFSGKISSVDRLFGTNCNPIVLTDVTFDGIDVDELAETTTLGVTDPIIEETAFANICKTDPAWTEIQTEQYLAGFAGRDVVDWDGWVYEVSEFGGQYKLLVAMEPPGGLLWTRDVEIGGIPGDLAVALKKGEPIRFSGRVSSVNRMFGTNCNPIVLTGVTFDGIDVVERAGAAISGTTDPTTVDATFTNICKTDPNWTEIQTEQYLAGFAGRDVVDWDGWVYEVSEFGGQYKLLVAMEPPGGLLWTRNVEIGGIPGDMAVALKKGEPIRFSGKISSVDRMFGANCNPIEIQDAVITRG